MKVLKRRRIKSISTATVCLPLLKWLGLPLHRAGPESKGRSAGKVGPSPLCKTFECTAIGANEIIPGVGLRAGVSAGPSASTMAKPLYDQL
jgi:hypothetical protein